MRNETGFRTREDSRKLDCFFNPRSIAVIGASSKPGKIGYELVRNLKLSKFQGDIFLVNPNSPSVMGLKTFRTVKDIQSTVDLAVIAIPADFVNEALNECAAATVKGVVIISSGFGEIGNIELERKLIETAKSSGIRLIGPNTFGIFSAKSKMNCTFGPHYVLSGKTALITQSGALGLALMAWTTEEKYGVSAIVSIGNKADVDDSDLLEYFGSDDFTKTIMIYMEGLKNGRKFLEVSKGVVPKKPIIAIKAGRSQRGALAVSSHTGAIAGQDRIYDVAFKEAGVMRANTMTQAFDWVQAINENPVPLGENIAIVTNGGGVGVLATDRCEELNMNLCSIPRDFERQLRSILPKFGSVRNPIDLTANADDEMFTKVLQLLIAREDIHAIIALFCETTNFDPTMIAEAIAAIRSPKLRQKAVTVAFVGGQRSKAGYESMINKGIAAYPTAERAVDGMYALITRFRTLKDLNSSVP